MEVKEEVKEEVKHFVQDNTEKPATETSILTSNLIAFGEFANAQHSLSKLSFAFAEPQNSQLKFNFNSHLKL